MTSFCANCGRPRDKAARFCGTCGTEFSADETRMDLSADATRIEPPAGSADPFASWYQPERRDTAPDVFDTGTGERWEPTQTVQAAPRQPPAYPPTAATPPFPPFPPVTPAGGPESGDHRTGLLIAAVVVVLAAAGGGAYAAAGALGQHTTAQPATTPAATTPAPSPPASSATGSRPASTLSASPTPTPSPTLSLVAVAPGVASSAAQPAAETLLSHYFQGINRHDYAEYAGTLSPAQRQEQSKSSFDSGYSSTTDSGMTLTSLAGRGSGGLTATVTFTSHQLAAQSVDKSTCNNWTLNLYLVPEGTGYLIGSAPAGYQPRYSDC